MQEHIADESIDLIVTSPPYNVGIEYDRWNDNLPEQEYWDFTKKWVEQSYRVLKIGGRICINIPVMGHSEQRQRSDYYSFHLYSYLGIIRNLFSLRECITWVKSFAEYDENVFCGGSTAWGSWLSPSTPWCRSFAEFILVAHKKEAKLRHIGVTDLTPPEFLRWTKNVWFFPSERDRRHPAPFPIELPYRLIKLYTYVGDTVLDPFMGGGTVAEACIRLNRQYIGFEISKNYCEGMKHRTTQTRL
jgi:site-specific DNA-methyltransferase (adenine-specific)